MIDLSVSQRGFYEERLREAKLSKAKRSVCGNRGSGRVLDSRPVSEHGDGSTGGRSFTEARGDILSQK